MLLYGQLKMNQSKIATKPLSLKLFKFSYFMTMTITSSLVTHIEFIGPWALVCPCLHYDNKLDMYLLLQRLSSVTFRAAKSIFSVVKGPFPDLKPQPHYQINTNGSNIYYWTAFCMCNCRNTTAETKATLL